MNSVNPNPYRLESGIECCFDSKSNDREPNLEFRVTEFKEIEMVDFVGQITRVYQFDPFKSAEVRSARRPHCRPHQKLFESSDRSRHKPMSILAASARPVISTLSNGLKVATVKVLSELSTVGLWIRSGSIYETPQNNGTAHFLEHLLFRGNSVYPKSALEDLAERTGVNIRAATSKAYTGFWAQAESRQVPVAIDAISQMTLNPSFDAAAVEAERPTILQEADEVARDFLEVVMEEAMKASFPDSPLGFPILGTRKTITTIDLKMIKDHYQTFFNPSNCYFSCATKLPHDQVAELVDKSTKFLVRRPEITLQAIENRINAKFNRKILRLASRVLDRSWVSLSIPAPPINSRDFMVWWLIKSAIGDVIPHRPFSGSPLLSNSGLEHLATSLDNLGKLSVLTLHGTCEAKREHDAVKALLTAVLNATMGMTDETLGFAKIQHQAKLATALTDTRTIAEELALQLLYWKRWRTLEDSTKGIDALTLDDVRRVAEPFFANDAPCTIVTVVPGGQA
jgi:predicted Zn-dependent peptidase